MFQNFTPDYEREEKNTGHSIHALITETTSTAHAAKGNETQYLFQEEKTLLILLYITLPFFFLGLFSNGAVIWFLCCRIKKTKYTVYVLNLAVADFSLLFCHIVYVLISLVAWDDSVWMSHFLLAFDILNYLGYNTSFFLLTAISVERYMGAFFPFCYRFKRPKHLSTILCAVLWALSCIMMGIDYLCWQEYMYYIGIYPANTIVTTVLMLFLPVMVFCSCSLFIKISRYPKSKSPARFYRTVFITVILFLIFAVPHKILCLMEYTQPMVDIKWTIIRSFSLLNLINSSLNPFVYFFVGRQKQQHSKEPLHVVIYRSCNDEILDHISSEQVA
ncbi:mas-related G-protein coupled receptor member H-like [Pantherophis guttatus]|uniref:Mas-related G-protein coupled receptor member H-like n=1 Tax=Pantherophis guttatus TaxID=94885 RepID=A0A6P9CY99_PANGU|nr:mas-related G-protein coupled receptor member H-like [Pantherophis guttatus]